MKMLKDIDVSFKVCFYEHPFVLYMIQRIVSGVPSNIFTDRVVLKTNAKNILL